MRVACFCWLPTISSPLDRGIWRNRRESVALFTNFYSLKIFYYLMIKLFFLIILDKRLINRKFLNLCFSRMNLYLSFKIIVGIFSNKNQSNYDFRSELFKVDDDY